MSRGSSCLKAGSGFIAGNAVAGTRRLTRFFLHGLVMCLTYSHQTELVMRCGSSTGRSDCSIRNELMLTMWIGMERSLTRSCWTSLGNFPDRFALKLHL